MDLHVRELPREDWPRLLALPFFADRGLPSGEGWRMLVAERDGTIVGFSALFDAVHWEPWWIAPDERGNAAIVRGMLREGKHILQELGAGGVFAMIDYSATDAHREMIERLGFQPAPGHTYMLATAALPEE
jgi:hypothetical protein